MPITSKKTRPAKVGLRQIAASAHVSLATVSRVLNGNNRVDPVIQKAVMDAAAKLKFDFSLQNKNKTLAFLLSNRPMLHEFHSHVLHGAEAYCAARSWDILFLSINYSSRADLNQLHLPKAILRRDMVRGVILAGTNSTNLLELFDHKGIPCVVLGNNVVGETQNLKCDMIFSDDIQGGQDITRYLISLEHRHIGFVGNLGLPWFARLYSGYCRAMEQSGLAIAHCPIESEDDVEIGYLGTKLLIARGEPITAIVAGNDTTAHGVYKALRDIGLKIPDDISVTGCDDTVGEWLYPGLTTIREFPEQLGKQMIEMMLTRIAQPGLKPQRVTVPTGFMKRDSCRAVVGGNNIPENL